MLIATLVSAVSAETREGSAPKAKGIFTKHFDRTLFAISGNAAFSIEVLLDDSEYPIGKNVAGIVVHDAYDNDVKDALLVIGQKDLASGGKAAGPFTVVDKQNGLYIVSGLEVKKEGRWELDVSLKKGSLAGGVKFIFPDALIERVTKGRYSP